MKKLAIIVAACALAACGSDKKTTKKTTGPAIGGTCSTANATACTGDTVLLCSGGQWAEQARCADRGQTCGEVATGTYDCKNPEGACTQNGFPQGPALSFYDADTQPYHTMTAFDSPTTPTMALFVENYVGWDHDQNPSTPSPAVDAGATATVDFAGPNDNYRDCGFCLIALKDDNGTQRFFMPAVGTANVTAPATWGPDQAFTMTLNNVEMREMVFDQSSQGVTAVPGGQTWCIPSVTITSPATLPPACGEDANENPITAGQAFCAKNQAGDQSEIWTCTDLTTQFGGDPAQPITGVLKSADCDDQGLTCDSATDPASTCQ